MLGGIANSASENNCENINKGTNGHASSGGSG
jgi:hypothetical protein